MGEQDSETVALRQGLKDFIEQKEAKFDFCVQLLQNLDKQPIEDTRVAWDANEFPFEKVATVTVPPQDPFTPKRGELR